MTHDMGCNTLPASSNYEFSLPALSQSRLSTCRCEFVACICSCPFFYLILNCTIARRFNDSPLAVNFQRFNERRLRPAPEAKLM